MIRTPLSTLRFVGSVFNLGSDGDQARQISNMFSFLLFPSLLIPDSRAINIMTSYKPHKAELSAEPHPHPHPLSLPRQPAEHIHKQPHMIPSLYYTIIASLVYSISN